ncbi:sodium:calcium antiporter [Rubrobacter calidifluminis]|uniref:sodium:calcium antiporter n=1 Tax=Rubrobacter calidifluminis TaxID=1392640 RepID=UPI0023618EC0|nr:hypothetical protein [Rubrobacter calidifluminis]
MTALELMISLVAILVAASLFTNAVEIVGSRLNMGQGAVGSVLAAVGTALPETMIPIVALIGAFVSGEDAAASGEIGIGAILGAPFLLASLAMCVVGASIVAFRGRRENGVRLGIERVTTRRDLGFFLVCFALAAAAGLVTLPFYAKAALAVLLIGAYAFYVQRVLRSGGAMLEEVPERLTLWRLGSRPPAWAAVAQLFGSLVVMALGAHFFVEGIERASHALGIPAGLIALVLAPLATELPEKFNSILWVREGKDTLALGNITGAMVFQSTIPVSIGLLLTEWELGALSAFSAALALVSGLMLYALLRSKRPLRAWPLLGGGAVYAVFVVVAAVSVALL